MTIKIIQDGRPLPLAQGGVVKPARYLVGQDPREEMLPVAQRARLEMEDGAAFPSSIDAREPVAVVGRRVDPQADGGLVAFEFMIVRDGRVDLSLTPVDVYQDEDGEAVAIVRAAIEGNVE